MAFFRNALSKAERAFRFSPPVLPVLLLLALAFSGCMRSEPRADLVILNGAEPESLDPAIITGQADIRVVLSLFEGLTRFDPVTGKGVAGLAERWDISADGRVYTFHLRANAVWSTGEPITAQDVVYSWLRALNPYTASDYAGELFFLENAEEYNGGKIKDTSLVGVRSLDDKTLRVNLKGPCAFFLDLCALQTLAIVPRKSIEAHGDRWIMKRPLPVSGAYLLEDWRIHDKIRLRKNPRYWDAVHTRNEIVDILPVESATIALNLYETGQADIIWDKNLIPTDLMDLLLKRPDCHTFPYLGTYFFRMNVTRKPLDDVRVRKALALAVDKRRLVEKLCRAGETPAGHFTPRGTANYDPPEGLGFDPDQARRLLAEAGYAGGKNFPVLRYLLDTPKQHEEIAIELQEMFRKELGIRMELRRVEWKVYLVAQSALDYDLCRSSWIGDYDDPNTFLDMWMSNNGNNRTGWKSSRYDELVREGNSQIDPGKRAQLLREAETLLLREGIPMTPIYFYAGITFYDSNKIDGIYFNMIDEHPVAAIANRGKR
jgi:oligopeptide transport system substrate-binding protein